ncbi:MAG TPA: divalent metal cation transporter, partial [Planosporangium sp.]|nr:divalent metal cation transporter [Planosporangium sp.]
LMVSILAVNVVTVAADLKAGAAAMNLLTGVAERWLVLPFAVALLALLLFGRYDEVQRILKYVMLCLLGYGVAALLAHPDWAEVARGLVPSLHADAGYIAGALALLGTTLTIYMYVWQTVEQVEEPVPPDRLRLREFDGVVGAVLAGAVFWFILVASGATLGVHHMRVDTAEQAAEALRPLAGPLAGELFAIGLLASAIIALPVILAAGGYAAAAHAGWSRGLSRRVTQAPGFYAVIVGQAVLGCVLAFIGVNPIRLLFIASLVAGVATPLGLIMLTLVAGDRRLMGERRVGRGLRVAGWVIVVLVSVVSAIYLAQQFG